MSSEEGLAYRSWVEVDLDNFTHNLREVRRLIGPGVNMLQVVKADAYGHGAIEISRTSLEHGVSHLGVANADEGIQLRVADITAPIVILSPSTVSEIPDIVKYKLSPSVSDVSFARLLHEHCSSVGAHASIHIEVDTGMGRGGTTNHDTIAMIEEILGFSHLSPEGIFTHLSQSERTCAFNDIQWRLFSRLLSELKKRRITIPFRHLANSGAVLNYPAFHLDMVRTGLMTYGIHPSPETRGIASLAPVMSFRTRILLIKNFPEGSGIGYGRTYITGKDTRIATVPVGYGDGYGFTLSNRGEALVAGKRAPIAGRISMDMTAIDVSHIPDCRVGDEVVLMGRQKGEEISADDIAALAGTISYEVICALGKRAPRVFLKRGKGETVEPRLRRIFIPDEEKSLARIDDIIRRCLYRRAENEELGEAIYYSMFETLFGREDRQLELRSDFVYSLTLNEFSPGEIEADASRESYFKVLTHVSYHKILTNDVFFVGCATTADQLASFFRDGNCEYRWLLEGAGDGSAAKAFSIASVRIDKKEVPLIKGDATNRGLKIWFGGDCLKDSLNRSVQVEIDILTKKSKKTRDVSVFLAYPVRGLTICFNYAGSGRLRRLRELAFFSGRNVVPSVTRKKHSIQLDIPNNHWVFPTSGVTFLWD